MPLVSMKYLLKHAQENKYAVGYFESWNMESMLSVIRAAEKMNSPVIIGFGGAFLGNSQRKYEENIYHYGALGREITKHAAIPAALLLNEANEVSMLVKGLNAGFNAIMYQKPGDTLEQAIEINKYLVRTAHYVDAAVEAEVGELPDSDISSGIVSGGHVTDPDEAVYFVKETGIDALAVSVGNVHLLERGRAQLDFELIETLRKKVSVPLVLHGGTGIDPYELKEAIGLGMCKLNVGTCLKRVFLKSIGESLNKSGMESTDPHELVGKGGKLDILMRAEDAMVEEVARFIQIIGSANKAGSL